MTARLASTVFILNQYKFDGSNLQIPEKRDHGT
jgi:hypothetical protein